MKHALHLLLLVSPLLALPPEARAAPAPLPKTAGARRDKVDDGRVEFRMENKPWRDVFRWLTDKSDLPFIVSCMPTGCFTFVGPKGARYSIPEVVAIVNRALLPTGCRLIRRPRCFTLDWSEDEPLYARVKSRPGSFAAARAGGEGPPTRGRASPELGSRR
jgi:hypothetical protein